MTIDLKALDAANKAAQASKAVAAAQKVFDQAVTDAIHALNTAPAPPVNPLPSIPRPFLPTSKINTLIPPNPPIHADSTAMIQNNPDWVIPPGDPAYPYREWIGPRGDAFYSRIDATTPKITVHVNYDDVLGYGCDRHIAQMPMPAALQAALTAGPLQNNNGYGWSVDADGNVWEACYLTGPGQPIIAGPACNLNQWNGLRCDYWGPGTSGNEQTGNGYGTTYPCSASHINVGAGQIRPEETGSSSYGHVLKIKGNIGADGSTAGHPKFVDPAVGGDGRIAGVRGIPYGARIQLDPAIDVATWPSVVAKNMPGLVQILRTLQLYGAIPVDSGGWARASGGLDAVDPVCWPTPVPWAAFGWSYDNGVPYDLMPHFRVIDWNKWS